MTAAAPALEDAPETSCGGFIACVGSLKIHLGYATWADGRVLLFCHEQIGPQPPTLWRQVWTGRENAVDAAENLCADAEDYIDSIHAPMRPYEDLDMDDFLHHIHLRVTNGFH